MAYLSDARVFLILGFEQKECNGETKNGFPEVVGY